MTTPSGRLFTIGDEEVGDEFLVVTLTGEMDMHAAPALDEHLTKSFSATSRRAVIDMRGVTFIDSTAIAVLLRLAKKRILSMVCDHDRVLDVLSIVGLDRLAPIFRTREDAFAGRGQLYSSAAGAARFGPTRASTAAEPELARRN
jgi:anti-sigma B factor antagonist